MLYCCIGFNSYFVDTFCIHSCKQVKNSGLFHFMFVHTVMYCAIINCNVYIIVCVRCVQLAVLVCIYI